MNWSWVGLGWLGIGLHYNWVGLYSGWAGLDWLGIGLDRHCVRLGLGLEVEILGLWPDAVLCRGRIISQLYYELIKLVTAEVCQSFPLDISWISPPRAKRRQTFQRRVGMFLWQSEGPQG